MSINKKLVVKKEVDIKFNNNLETLKDKLSKIL